MDILPTVVSTNTTGAGSRDPDLSVLLQLDLAGVKPVGKEFRGREVVVPRGKTWATWLDGSKNHVHDENAIHGWERKWHMSIAHRGSQLIL
jgi:hypothetical protein